MPSGIALPESPGVESPAAFLNPSWNQHRRSQSGARSKTYSQRSSQVRDQVIENAHKIHRRFLSVWRKLTPLQKLIAVAVLVTINVLGILFLIFNERIFGFLEPFAARWKNTTGGWTILWAMTFMTAFPPMIGYSTCGTIAGFVYGVGEGWLVYATATVAGSFCSIIVSRTVLRRYVEKIVANDKRFAALTLTLKEDGLKLLCMIRLCPLPYSLSNGAMSTFPTVHPAMYALATATVSPKLLIQVFIGSRLAAIARNKEDMSLGDKALNWGSILGGALIGAFTGWFIYRKTMARAKELEAEEEEAVRDSVRRTGAPPPEFMDDPEAQVAAQTLAQDEDDEMAFFDDDAEESRSTPYRDDQNDEDAVFRKGNGDDDEAISLHQQGR